jgi:hypothetical protein
MYIQSVDTTAVLLSLHVSVLIGPSSGDVHRIYQNYKTTPTVHT